MRNMFSVLGRGIGAGGTSPFWAKPRLCAYLDECLICCNLSVLPQGWQLEWYGAHPAQFQELHAINLAVLISSYIILEK